jgi:hypothetical protein
MLNYLWITKLRVGVILNLKHRKLEWERIVSQIGVYSCRLVVSCSLFDVSIFLPARQGFAPLHCSTDWLDGHPG